MINCTLVTKRAKVNIMLHKGRQLDLNINLQDFSSFSEHRNEVGLCLLVIAIRCLFAGGSSSGLKINY